jgi:imidazolonepropionase-like amidohydrolase
MTTMMGVQVFNSDSAATLFAACVITFLAGCTSQPSDLPVTAHQSDVPISTPLRLDHVTVVDTLTGVATPDMSILMQSGRISAIKPTAAVTDNASIHTINARGKFVVPGYNDMHTHALTAPNATAVLALLLADGVTGVRQMDGSPELLAARAARTLPLSNDAPALLVAPGNLILPFDATSVDGAQAEVRQQKQQGADFIKIASTTPPVFFAAVAEARRVGLPAVGHLQGGVSPADAARAGMRSIEHLGPGSALWIGCSTQEATLLAEAAANPRPPVAPFKIPGFVQKLLAGTISKMLVNPAAFETPDSAAILQRTFDTYSEAKCQNLAAIFASHQTWQVPTLVRLRTEYLADLPEYAHDPALPYMSPAALREWRAVTQRYQQLPPAMLATFHDAYRRSLLLTKLFADSDVPMMTGTDNGGQVPGQSLHQEFDELAKAGLSPLKILQMTTLDPAQFLGRTATMGSVEAGHNADLVLLDRDPVSSVQNLHRIAGVVRAGRYYSPADLDALRLRVKAGQGYLH